MKIALPDSIIKNPNLNCNEKLFFSDIFSASKTRMSITGSNSELAQAYGVSKRTIANWVSNLTKHAHLLVMKETVYRGLSVNPYSYGTTYIKIPKAVRVSKKINSLAKLLYGEVYTFSQNGKECFCTNKYLSKKHNNSISRVSTCICELVNNGFLNRRYIKKHRKTKRILTINNDKLMEIENTLKEEMDNKMTNIEKTYGKDKLDFYRVVQYKNCSKKDKKPQTGAKNNESKKAQTSAKNKEHNTLNYNNINILLNYKNKRRLAFCRKRKDNVYVFDYYEKVHHKLKKCVGFNNEESPDTSSIMRASPYKKQTFKGITIQRTNYTDYSPRKTKNISAGFPKIGIKKQTPKSEIKHYKQKPTPQQMKTLNYISTTLFNTLKIKRRIFKKPNINSWNHLVWKGCCDMGYEVNYIKTVMDWYIQHVDDEYMPAVFSMDSFCEKFPSIAYQYDRVRSKELYNIYKSRGFFRRKLINHDFYDVYEEKLEILQDDVEKYYNEKTQTVLPGADLYPSDTEYHKYCKDNDLKFRECPEVYYTEEYKQYASQLNLKEYHQSLIN